MRSSKEFLIPNSTLDEFLMIPLTFLYDEYIDRPKFSEQKKYLTPPPPPPEPRGVGRKKQTELWTIQKKYCPTRVRFSLFLSPSPPPPPVRYAAQTEKIPELNGYKVWSFW